MKRTKKRLLSILSAVALTLCSLPQEGLLTLLPPMTAHAEESYTEVTDEGGIRYAVYVDHAEVIGAADVIGTSSSHGQAIIQSEINGRPVTVIGKLAFALRQDLYSVVIPDSVEIIKEKAFADSRLQQLHNMSNVKVIEANAFFSVNIKSIELPDSLTELGDLAFAKCSLLSSLSIGSGLRTIGNNPFAGDKYFGVDPITGEPLGTGLVCSEENPYFKMKDGALWSADGKRLVCSNQLWSNTEYEIPVGTVDISYAFYESDIETVTVPASVTKMDYAFSKCKRLQNITLCEGLKSINQYTFEGCEKLESLKLPDSLTKLEDHAFAGATTLQSVTLGSKLDYIGQYAFSGCEKLESLKLPDSLTELGEYALAKATGLQSVTFGSKLESIGKYTFSNCTNLKTLTLPDSLTTIGDYAFASMFSNEQCGLQSITFGKNLESIGRYAFQYCQNLKSLTIPDTVIKINDFAFIDCNELQSISFGSGVRSIGNGVLIRDNFLDTIRVSSKNPYFKEKDGGLWTIDETRLVSASPQWTEYEIPDGVTDIHYAFYGMKALKKVTVPASVTNSSNAFRNCRNLSDVTLCKGLLDLDNFAFSECENLRSLSLPEGMGSISENALSGLTSLTEITFPASMKKIEASALSNNPLLETVTFYAAYMTINSKLFGDTPFLGEIDGYSNSTAEKFAREHGYPFRSLGEYTDPLNLQDGESIEYEYDGMTFAVFNDHAELLHVNNSYITKLTIPAKVMRQPVTVIGERAVYNSHYLNSVIFPDTITEIKKEAFTSCESLQTVNLPNNLQKLGTGAFEECDLQGSVTIPASVTLIYWNVFTDNPGLTSINVEPNSESYVSVDGILYNKKMTKLLKIPEGFTGTSYTLPDSVDQIGSTAVSKCKTIEEFNISASSKLRFVEDEAFTYCTALKSICLPDTVEFIGNTAFLGCSALTSIRLSRYEYLNILGGSMFTDCTSLKEIVFPENFMLFGRQMLSNTPALERVVFLNPTAKLEYKHFFAPYDTNPPAICGWSGSTAEAFADENALEFVAIDKVKDYTQDGIKYSFKDGKAIVTGYTKGITEANIPAEVLGMPVVEIQYEALKGCKTLKSLTLPEGLIYISTGAFSNCTALSGTIQIPDSVQTIEGHAFSGCSSVSGFDFGTAATFDNPNSKLTEIGDAAFRDCSSVMFIDLPSSVKSIGDSAFENCKTLLTMSCGKGMEYVGSGAFANCTSLSVIDFGPNLESLGDYVCENCSSLSMAELPETCESIGEYAFVGCSDPNFCISFYNLNTEIPDAAETICGTTSPVTFEGTILGYKNSTAEEYAEKYGYTFRLVRGAEDDEIERDDITYKLYDDHAEVIGCKDTLKKAFIKESVRNLQVTVIAEEAFKDKTSLQTVTIPDSVKIISARAFAGCSVMTFVEFGNGVEEIGSGAFKKTNLWCVTLPDSVKKIGDSAFSSMSSLLYFNCGSGLTEFGTNVFTLSNRLKSITIPDDSKYFTFNYDAYMLFSADGTRICAVPNEKNYSQKWSYKIPSGVTDIRYAFRGLTLADRVTVPESVTDAEAAFQGCTGLTEVIVDAPEISKNMFDLCCNLQTVTLNNTKTVNEAAFQNCTALTKIAFPDTCENISDYALGNCPALEKVEFYNPECVISSKIFAVNDSTLTEVPFTGKICGYEGSTAQIFAEENGYQFESWGKLSGYLVYKVEDDHIVIVGHTNALPEKAKIPAEIDGLPVTEIGYEAFADWSALKAITLPDSLKAIGSNAFRSTGLTALTIPASVTTIGTYAFAATRMKEVEIPANIETLGNNAFSGCPNLEKITVSANEICAFAFEDNPKLTTVTLTDSVKKIGGGVFGNDVLLERVEIPATVEFLGDKPFEGAVKMNTDGRLIVRTTESIFDGLLSEDFGGTVYGYPESGAQSYCADFGYRFVPICTVSYAANGGKGEMTGEVVFGEITLPECGFTAPTGKNFAGWTAGDDGIIYPAGKTMTLAGDTVITATWQTVTVTVMLDANGGEGTAVRSSVISGSLFTFPNCTFTAPEGKQFAGWQVGEKIYQVGDSLKVTKDTKATAVWEKTNPAFLVGDVDGDGKVDTKDAMILSRYVGGWDGIVLDMNAADLDRDGIVDVRDAMILSRYVAAWEGYDKYIIEIE